MPFTLSHAALVLPATFLPKKTYSLTGLVIGSFVPDFEYFIRMRDYSIYSHTWLGLLWFDLPLAFMLAYIYHGVVRNALLENLPRGIYVRFLQTKQFNWAEYVKTNWFVVIISILLGAASHIFWDSFTHYDGYFVKLFPTLRHHVMIFGIWIPLYNLCQHLSTLVGGLVVIYYIFQLPKYEPVNQKSNMNYWIYIMIISLIIIVLKLFAGLNYRSFDQTIITVISSGLMAITVTSLLFRAKFAPAH